MDLHQVTLQNIRTTLVGLLHMLGRQRPPQLHAAPFYFVEAALAAIGFDTRMVALFPKMRPRDLCALACASRSLHTLVTNYREAVNATTIEASYEAVAQLTVEETEVEWGNVTFHLFEAVLGAFGEDALIVALLPKMSYRDLRALACASRSLHTLVAAYKDTFAQLTVMETDVDWGNVTFVAGMRNLVQLCVGDVTYDLVEKSDLLPASRPRYDLTIMRTQSPLDVVELSVAAALFLGAILGDSLHMLILADGREMDATELRTCEQLDLDFLLGIGMAPIAEADIALLRGVIWCNPNLELGTALEQLRTRAFVNSREALHVQAADEEGLANAEREYMEWARAWYVWAQRNAQ